MKVDFLFICSEGWEKMEPTQKGAFCHTCMKEVSDFSMMKITEIKGVLGKEERGTELCGRFKPVQMLELNFSDFFKRFRLWNLSRKLALVFFFVLGGMLFSCSTRSGFDKEERLAGTVAISDSALHPKQGVLKEILQIEKRE